MVSPGSTKPAKAEYSPSGKRVLCPIRQCSPPLASLKIGSMIATGSVRGKCSAAQATHTPIAAIGKIGGAAAIGTETMPLVPIDQGLGLAQDGGVRIGQDKGRGAQIAELA